MNINRDRLQQAMSGSGIVCFAGALIEGVLKGGGSPMTAWAIVAM